MRDKPEDLPAGVRQRAGLALSTLHRPRVLFLDEPTAGVDVHNRALFWELIQEEADAGTTVFVTTHFLEEADYCDWISFIDAGRLVADASPAELRRRFSPGYHVELAAGSPADAVRAETLLRERGVAAERTSSDTLVVRAPELDGRVQAVLGDVASALPGLRVSVRQPEMTDVFRELMKSAAERAPKAAA